ncbi:hypothetical protein RRG08_027235 [Elysia crispata]|uniref:Carbonic anhydrase n=1 Tax=Elysia crispata TaxID=231223 RepID=A0AAE0ZU59_9GAST|nr:hypothetical protein RRG08_027235 [Elysia crispata]
MSPCRSFPMSPHDQSHMSLEPCNRALITISSHNLCWSAFYDGCLCPKGVEIKERLIYAVTDIMCQGWSYEGATGPAFWKDYFPICGLAQQSPINIYEGDVQETTMQPFAFINYNTLDAVTMANNGHSVVIDLSRVEPKLISGGGLMDTYQAAQFHFHWGSTDSKGSEHLISSQMYPMELHIVHYNTKYENLSVAVDKPDGLAVLGFMFEVGVDNAAYSEIVTGLAQVKTDGASTSLATMNLQSLIADTADFFRYKGSLTTPACFESVTWTVFKSTIKISKAQLAAFRTVLDSQNRPLVDNYRPVQPLYGRVVEASFSPNIKWGYLDDQASRWALTYEACGGQRQSPIDILPSGSQLDETLPDFQFYNYDTTQGIAMELSNNGHTAEVSFTSGTISIAGGGLGETYVAAQFHLHWGSTNMKGSEHKVDGNAYPAELHIVHYKASLGSLGAAVKRSRGLAVLGFFLEISESDNPALKPLMDALVNVRNPGSTAYALPQAFSLDSILPPSFTNFYRYDGSLTTPGCFESVVWTVFRETIPISSSQLSLLRSLKSSEKVDGVSAPLQDNFREVQPIGNRIVRRNFRFAASWSYEGPTGVQFWSQTYPKCASDGASAQSPINIKDTSAKYDDILPITLLNYGSTQGVAWELSNNGHTVTATLTSGDIGISGGGFSDTYKVAQFHLHWGSSSDRGSEHLINSKAYPMELHIVHYGESRGSVSQALTHPNGLAVLGFMFEISAADNPFLTPIVEKLKDIKYKGNSTALSIFSLRNIIPKSLDRFYRYSGSLTTPGCFESVTWTVFRSTISISESQLQEFREVMSSDIDPATNTYKPMVNNYRPPQPINGRVVFANFQLDPDAAPGVQASLILCALCSLFSAIVLAQGKF